MKLSLARLYLRTQFWGYGTCPPPTTNVTPQARAKSAPRLPGDLDLAGCCPSGRSAQSSFDANHNTTDTTRHSHPHDPPARATATPSDARRKNSDDRHDSPPINIPAPRPRGKTRPPPSPAPHIPSRPLPLPCLLDRSEMDTAMEDVGRVPAEMSPAANLEPTTTPTLDGWIEGLMNCKQLSETDVQRLCEKVSCELGLMLRGHCSPLRSAVCFALFLRAAGLLWRCLADSASLRPADLTE